MAQETGTEILARARIIAQDNDANSNFAVGAADALSLLNDILVSLSNNQRAKTKTIAATTSGLTFASGDVSKVTTADIDATEFESFHQSNSSALSYPLSRAIERVTVQEMLEMLRFDGNTALSTGGSEWTHVAAEKTQDDTQASGVERWRVWGYPVINTTRHMTVKAIVPVTISTITFYPDIDTVDSRVVSRLLGYEIARLKKEVTQEFLNNILRFVPQNILDMVYGGAVRGNQLQSHVIQRND